MSVTVTAHLNFHGQAREALDFYASVFGGEKLAFRYEDMGNVQDPADAQLIMWGQVQAPNGFRVMAYDVPTGVAYDPGVWPFFVSIRGDDPEEIKAFWAGLSDGAEIMQPLAEAPWSPLYGRLTDKFGVIWTLDVIADGAG